ncbi:MAG: phosphoadenosine phosphosulfate reductase family protein [bacterium]|nr:phosphoadenosine phosphosulfate reductase family protein [bacterium]
MYSYNWDPETGGILLNSTPLQFSKEPRPVYYKELDLLGFDKYWNYDKDDSRPYMWAESSNYFYRGRLVAKTKGGTMFEAPKIEILDDPEPNKGKLKFVDIDLMAKKNRGIIDQLAQFTIKKAYETYLNYRNKVDIFYVAFSGGKDSVVTLDMVSRALPHSDFKVVFGNTGMEFPDTYELVKKVKEKCETDGIDFRIAKSHLNPLDSWKKFGPPATVTRWCCSVHKTAPQILLLRELTKKPNFTGMAFVGIRAAESLSRSEYGYVALGEKHKGQYSCNPILDWNSAELYLYIYQQHLPLNDAYKKGNSRAGCLVCPNVSERNAFFRKACYSKEYDQFISIIEELYRDKIPSSERMEEFLSTTGWRARMNGRDLNISIGCREEIIPDFHIIHVTHPHVDWKEWIKTIGVLLTDASPYKILYKGNTYSFDLKPTANGYDVYIPIALVKKDAVFVKFLKNVFHKSACCVGCRECEADCHNGFIKMIDGKVHISDNCYHCTMCHKVDRGCLIYKSLELPKGVSKMEKKSLNCYSTHAPLISWFEELFERKDDFFISPSINGPKVAFFSTFLKHAGLLEDGKLTELFDVCRNQGLQNQSTWALMLSNLAYTPEVNWYVMNVNFNEELNKAYIISKLLENPNCANERAATDIFRAYCRILALGFNEVGLGSINSTDKKNPTVLRTPWYTPEPKVVLYSLFKFAEKCGDFYQFSLKRLMNTEIESDGISPVKIFGISEEAMQKILLGLSVAHPDFISASFTLDLDNINLKPNKTSQDVLKLF